MCQYEIDAHISSNNIDLYDDKMLQRVVHKRCMHEFHVLFFDLRTHASTNTNIDDNRNVVLTCVVSECILDDSIHTLASI